MNGHVLTFPIDLCVYDLGKKILSPNGDNLENIWYTTILAFGREYAFSLAGVECCQPRGTIYGEPRRVEHIGDTEIPYSIFFDFVLSLSENAFRPLSYDVKHHNSTKFCDEVLQFTCGVRLPKYLFELPDTDLFSSKWEELVVPLLKKVAANGNETGNTALDLLLAPSSSVLGASSNGRNHVLLNCLTPKSQQRRTRDPSPDLIEIQAQIEAIKADQKTLKERRGKMRHSSSREASKEPNHHPSSKKSPSPPSKTNDSLEIMKERKRSSSRNGHHHRSSSRQKSPYPNCQCNCSSIEPADKESTAIAKAEEPIKTRHTNKSKTRSRHRSRSRKSSSRKKVSFDETPPVEISSRETSNDYEEDEEVDEDMLPELQEDDLFSTYDSLKAHASPSPPPALLWTDLSKEEKKTLSFSKAKSPSASEQAKPFVPVEPPAKTRTVANKTKEEGIAPQEQQQQQRPITFRELDHMGDFEDLVRDIIDLLNHEEQTRLYEMEMWIMNGEGVWVLDDTFIAFLGRVLHDTKTFASDHRVLFLRLLAYGANQEDFSLILHMDRKPHHIMNYAKDFDRLPILEQEALALFFANMFETCSEWLLYISEWSQEGTTTYLSNVKVTTKVAVSSVLGETSSLQDYGTAILHNFSAKEVKSVVFDDVYTELTMAILQFLQGKPSEEKVFRSFKALDRFCSLSRREVPQLVKMIGPEPSKFNGMSSRVEELVGRIQAHLARV